MCSSSRAIACFLMFMHYKTSKGSKIDTSFVSCCPWRGQSSVLSLSHGVIHDWLLLAPLASHADWYTLIHSSSTRLNVPHPTPASTTSRGFHRSAARRTYQRPRMSDGKRRPWKRTLAALHGQRVNRFVLASPWVWGYVRRSRTPNFARF